MELASLEEELHGDLLTKAEEILRTLDEEIGKTSLIPHTRQRLYSQMVALRLTQEDHLETEEALVLPMLRLVMNEEQQMEIARPPCCWMTRRRTLNGRWNGCWGTFRRGSRGWSTSWWPGSRGRGQSPI